MELQIKDYNIEEYHKYLDIKKHNFYEVFEDRIFLDDKFLLTKPNLNGFKISDHLFDYQKFIVKLCLQKKKFGVFADAGLGKTMIFLELIKLLSKKLEKKILILSPLMIIEQTLKEQSKWYPNSEPIIHCSSLDGFVIGKDKIGITNYDKFRKPYNLSSEVDMVILDESSILKNYTGVIKTNLINSFKGIQYKFCFSATPAPNDRLEYGSHASFLEYVPTENEFKSMFFVNREGEWYLRGHSEGTFLMFLSSMSLYMKSPKEFGFDDNLKDLPPVEIKTLKVDLTKEQIDLLSIYNKESQRQLFLNNPTSMTQRTKFNQISKGFILENGKIKERFKTNKLKTIKELIENNIEKSVLIWTVYDEEGDLIERELSQITTAFNLKGSVIESNRYKYINAFLNGELKVLISKPRLLGFGLNLQICSLMIFSGLNDSWEQTYQAIKRAYRYGNKNKLLVYFIYTEAEKLILDNVFAKKETFEEDTNKMQNQYKENYIEILENKTETNISKTDTKINIKKGKDYTLINGDSIIVMDKLKENSIDLAVFSPPFSSLFSYSNSENDMGNNKTQRINNSLKINDDGFHLQLKFFIKALKRVMKEGHIVCVHCQNLTVAKERLGYIGLRDFRGDLISMFVDLGFIYFSEIVIAKNPQSIAIKNHIKGLLFITKNDDGRALQPCFNDFILIFRKPGEYKDKVKVDITNEEWIKFACGVWNDIKETDVLSVNNTKATMDEKHVCPLQLEVIRRLIRMYSNKGELILDPFSGIGSTGFISLEQDRKYLGIELKKEYYKTSINNLDLQLELKKQKLLFEKEKNE